MIEQLRSPLELVRLMDQVLDDAKRGTAIIHKANKAYLDAKHGYEQAFMESKLDQVGTVGDREAQAKLACWDRFTSMEIAEMALKHAQNIRKELMDELNKLQTESALVRSEMSLGR